MVPQRHILQSCSKTKQIFSELFLLSLLDLDEELLREVLRFLFVKTDPDVRLKLSVSKVGAEPTYVVGDG